uniref:Calcium-binding protein n=1 Tax=Schistocephalus solidus TaxID=70667 RepID=A0A0X3NYG9_SCHSO
MTTMAERYIDAFIAADKDGSGTLTRDELTAVLKENGVSAAKVDKLMSKLDLNGDGIITLGEYKVALNISSQPMDAWRELFDLIDVDKSGAIDAEELIRFLNESGNGQLVAAVKNWIKEFDENCDGKLQYKEFLKFVASTEC